jgi:hypothetical protein
MMHKAGAASIVALEANTRAFLKCLCVKEIFNLDRVDFQLGDFSAYIAATSETFDIVIGSGVLYHMADPISVLNNLVKLSDKIFLWTHYYDADSPAVHSRDSHRFEAPVPVRIGDFEGVSAKRYYGEALDWQGFSGGSAPHAVWLGKETILAVLKARGFHKIEIAFDHPDHPNGPAFAFSAMR